MARVVFMERRTVRPMVAEGRRGSQHFRGRGSREIGLGTVESNAGGVRTHRPAADVTLWVGQTLASPTHRTGAGIRSGSPYIGRTVGQECQGRKGRSTPRFLWGWSRGPQNVFFPRRS